MIELETTKIWTGDGFGAAYAITLKQEKVFRFPTPINGRSGVAMYSRWTKDGKFGGYEVFQIKILPKGHKCFAAVVEEDTEKYPTAENFGRIAWHIWAKPLAEEAFQAQIDKLTGKTKVVETDNEDEDNDNENAATEEIHVPVVHITPTNVTWVIPDGEFTTAQFGMVNNLPVPGKGYFELKNLLSSGKIVEVARRKVSEGRGRATVFFSKVA